ncbi:Tumor necrosis factor ligand superfamily member 12 APO3 ligand TNF-related weak inducer of apoptosis [Triplophysa tibetana]|uniref:Tumor necrosis factor ligand superfamily member 12 APO3 ligand TNF-related weak inducer of apoptosis n=1 Tax=Triplophysa tibetana TaxID=1572043 RepID=A0A5A9PQ22_9TELE|nr:Tumor necrosis factor ligand superfamily member 12 APO3 ligand TNF-related weak inducer of apoptosis [Triplophysa tibetana]
MQRILQRRRIRTLRLAWSLMAVVALSLAVCSAIFTVWTLRQTRDLSRSFKTLQERLEQVNMQRKAIFQLILEKRELLESQRFRRNVTKDSVQKVGTEGVIKGWTEEVLNMSRAVHYNPDTGTFKVERSGVYFLYCQVHFNENQSQYVKLEVSVPKGPLLQCMEGYGTTPASGSHKFHFLKPCQVSGLLRLNKGAELKAVTGRSFSLQESGKHYFGLFRVN